MVTLQAQSPLALHDSVDRSATTSRHPTRYSNGRHPKRTTRRGLVTSIAALSVLGLSSCQVASSSGDSTVWSNEALDIPCAADVTTATCLDSLTHLARTSLTNRFDKRASVLLEPNESYSLYVVRNDPDGEGTDVVGNFKLTARIRLRLRAADDDRLRVVVPVVLAEVTWRVPTEPTGIVGRYDDSARLIDFVREIEDVMLEIAMPEAVATHPSTEEDAIP